LGRLEEVKADWMELILSNLYDHKGALGLVIEAGAPLYSIKGLPFTINIRMHS